MSECLRPSGSNKIYCHDKDCQKCSVEVSNLKEISHLKSQLATLRELLEEARDSVCYHAELRQEKYFNALKDCRQWCSACHNWIYSIDELNLGERIELALKKCFGEKEKSDE